MKPTCPTSCPLIKKVAIERKLKNELGKFRLLSRGGQYRLLASVTFLYYCENGFTKFSTWLEMIRKQDIFWTAWGFFCNLEFETFKGKV